MLPLVPDVVVVPSGQAVQAVMSPPLLYSPGPHAAAVTVAPLLSSRKPGRASTHSAALAAVTVAVVRPCAQGVHATAKFTPGF